MLYHVAHRLTRCDNRNMTTKKIAAAALLLMLASCAADQTGTDGADGSPGTIGADGSPGPNGSPGPVGVEGVDGVDGANGSPGPAGPPGANGSPGAQGLPGSQGSQGQTGAQGATGANGSPGAIGPPGATGAAGMPQSKSDLYVATSQVVVSSNGSAEVKAMCNNTIDIVLHGSCSRSSFQQHTIADEAWYPSDPAQVSGWRCFAAFYGSGQLTVTARATCIAL